MVFCAGCGQSRVGDSKFCAGCGAGFPALPQQLNMGGGTEPPPKYGTPLGPNGMPQPVTLMPTQALELPGALNRCYLGLGWASKAGKRELDLDASAALFSEGKCVDIVSFQQVYHTWFKFALYWL